MPTSRLIIFVRAPQLGAVKTRLAVALGPDAALAAYRRLLDTLSHSLKNLPGVELRHTPDAAGELLQPWLQSGWALAGQGSGPLGERLSRAAEQAFQEGVEHLFIIGSDSPEITEQDIQSAWNALLTTDVVLGPAEDGGYWGIGLRGPFCEVFQNIDWSTPAVLQQTLARARQTHRSITLLRTLSDVDTEADWQAWLRRVDSRPCPSAS